MTTLGAVAGMPFLALVDFAALPDNYIAAEYFLRGEAVAQGKPAAFVTRLVIIRPAAGADFNGTVLVEWLNVSGGTDAPADWNYLHREIVRGGYAYVGVSAQQAGVELGASGLPGALPLKAADPERYKSLHHPGDAWAYDIFSQAGRAVPMLLGGLIPHRVLAIGESQSAGFLTTYVNAIDPVAPIFDGFLLHSRFRGAAPLDGAYLISVQALGAGRAIDPVPIREDARVPVLMFITETDLMMPVVGYRPARQRDTGRIRTWEVAGTAHADTYTLRGGAIDTGRATATQLASIFAPLDTLFGQTMPKSINAAPQHHYVLQAALDALDRWVRTGTPPPATPKLAINEVLELDSGGNAIGGIRTPWVDVPIATYSGIGQPGDGFAVLFGSTVMFDAAILATLYPGGRDAYLAQFGDALDHAIEGGVMLAADRDESLAMAAVMFDRQLSAR
ncbi:alpha/beta hydrolase domain-containing protein [Sphingomonas sp. 28-63-12]|uniref:alpha/beta hydrolase domain-containing protein n=1 Tax=Sphingomonas sp. 28-63-12 TaxID=1970434 RepID=UPI0035A8ECA6